MSYKVTIVHGWSGNPDEGWFPWLKAELTKRDFWVSIPQLPDADTPRIENWVPALAQAVQNPDANTILVGHSMGCQTIARYLATLPDEIKIAGAVFVAGFFNRLTKLESASELAIAEPWLKTPLDLVKVKSHLKKSVAIFSDNDYYVPADNQPAFRDRLGSQIVVEHNLGHFSGTDECKELPSVLAAVLKIANLS